MYQAVNMSLVSSPAPLGSISCITALMFLSFKSAAEKVPSICIT
jgi:hypothetical protein